MLSNNKEGITYVILYIFELKKLIDFNFRILKESDADFGKKINFYISI
jgi:hypothetical protein